MNWDTSLAGNSKVTVILAIIGLGLVIIAAKLFGYVLAIAEFAYGIIVFLIYLKLLFGAIRRREIKFIVISLILIIIGVAYGFISQLTVANVSLQPEFAGIFYSAILVSLAGLFYESEIPFFTGEKLWDLLMIVLMFCAVFAIVYIITFIISLSDDDLNMYYATDWLTQNRYIEERINAQTQSGFELVKEYVNINSDNIEALLNEKAINEYTKSQFYDVNVREYENEGRIQYKITDEADPDNENQTVVYLDIDTLEWEWN